MEKGIGKTEMNEKEICDRFVLNVPKGTIMCEPDGENVFRLNFSSVWNFWIDEKGVSFEIGGYANVKITPLKIVFRAMIGGEFILELRGFDMKINKHGVTLYIWLKE